MSKELLQKLALYSILPCILAIAAVFLNNLFQPQLHWQLKPLEHKDMFSQIEGLDNNRTTLFNEPVIRVHIKGQEWCSTEYYYGKMIYVHNKPLQDKFFLETLVRINNVFTGILLFLTIVQAGGDAYLLFIYKRVNWRTTVALLLLVAIVIIGLSVLVPLKNYGVMCFIPQEVKVEATLISMSLDGLFYLFIGGIVNILATIIMVKRYRTKPVFEQTAESTS